MCSQGSACTSLVTSEGGKPLHGNTLIPSLFFFPVAPKKPKSGKFNGSWIGRDEAVLFEDVPLMPTIRKNLLFPSVASDDRRSAAA